MSSFLVRILTTPSGPALDKTSFSFCNNKQILARGVPTKNGIHFFANIIPCSYMHMSQLYAHVSLLVNNILFAV